MRIVICALALVAAIQHTNRPVKRGNQFAGTCPGIKRPLVSPNRRWSVECREKPTNKPDEDHHVILQDARSGRSEELHACPRGCDLFWSPAGDRLALEDNYASTDTNSFVYTPTDPARVEDVFELLRAQQSPSSLAFVDGKDHVYLEVVRWIDNAHLRVRLWGHGDQQSFDRRYTVRIE